MNCRTLSGAAGATVNETRQRLLPAERGCGSRGGRGRACRDSSCDESVVEAAEGRARPVGGRVAAGEVAKGASAAPACSWSASMTAIGALIHSAACGLGRDAGLECHDERKQDRVLLLHVIEQVALQNEERLLQPQRTSGRRRDDSRPWRPWPRAAAAPLAGARDSGVDVGHESRQRGVCPGWSVALGRRSSLEFGDQGSGADLALGAHAGEW